MLSHVNLWIKPKVKVVAAKDTERTVVCRVPILLFVLFTQRYADFELEAEIDG